MRILLTVLNAVGCSAVTAEVRALCDKYPRGCLKLEEGTYERVEDVTAIKYRTHAIRHEHALQTAVMGVPEILKGSPVQEAVLHGRHLSYLSRYQMEDTNDRYSDTLDGFLNYLTDTTKNAMKHEGEFNVKPALEAYFDDSKTALLQTYNIAEVLGMTHGIDEIAELEQNEVEEYYGEFNDLNEKAARSKAHEFLADIAQLRCMIRDEEDKFRTLQNAFLTFYDKKRLAVYPNFNKNCEEPTCTSLRNTAKTLFSQSDLKKDMKAELFTQFESIETIMTTAFNAYQKKSGEWRSTDDSKDINEFLLAMYNYGKVRDEIITLTEFLNNKREKFSQLQEHRKILAADRARDAANTQRMKIVSTQNK